MRLKSWIAAVALVLVSALPVSAGSMLLTGVGPPPTVAATYQGPGDIAGATATFWGSCARGYSASYSNGTNSLCDLVDASTGATAICTLRVKTNGFVDLTGTYCTGSQTPAVACAAASGGACVVSKLYNQANPGVNDAIPAGGAGVLSNMPGLAFSQVNSLPAMNCGTAAAALVTPNLTIAQPLYLMGVYLRNGSFTTNTSFIGSNTATVGLGGANVANTAALNAGTQVTASGATDNAYHGLQGLANGASSALNLDGVDTTSLSAGTGAFVAVPLRVCRIGGTFLGLVAEAGLWASGGSVSRSAVYTNWHGVNGYNGAF